jgi:hypothetical protein
LWSEARVSARRLGLGDPRFVSVCVSQNGSLLPVESHQTFLCFPQILLQGCLHVQHVFLVEETREEGRPRPVAVSRRIPCAFVRRVSPGRTDAMTEHLVWWRALLFLTRTIRIVSETGEQCQWLR